MNNKKRAVCLGMAAADVLIQGIDLRQGIQGDYQAEEIQVDTGGDALNQSIVLSKLGHAVTLMSLVGDDSFGEMIRKQCRRFGVCENGITVTGKYPTSVSVVCVRHDGERSFITHRQGTVDKYAMEHINLDLLDRTVKVLSLGSMGGSGNLDGKNLAQILHRAKKYGTITVADMVDNLGRDTIRIMSEAFPFIDYLIPSREEMVCFTGCEYPEDGAEIFHRLGVKNVIVKLGAQGSYISSAEFTGIIPPFKVPVVDTTGAGDNFTGGFIAGLMEGYEVRECVRYASAVAAASIQAVGAVNGVIDKKQIEMILQLG